MIQNGLSEDKTESTMKVLEVFGQLDELKPILAVMLIS
jgi:hypothetical protein